MTPGVSAAPRGADYGRAVALSAASALALRRVRQELRALGHTELARRAHEAALDCVRHARLLRALAAAHGQRAPRIELRVVPRGVLGLAVAQADVDALRASLREARALSSREPGFAAASASMARDAARAAGLSRDVAALLDAAADPSCAFVRLLAPRAPRPSADARPALPCLPHARTPEA